MHPMPHVLIMFMIVNNSMLFTMHLTSDEYIPLKPLILVGYALTCIGWIVALDISARIDKAKKDSVEDMENLIVLHKRYVATIVAITIVFVFHSIVLAISALILGKVTLAVFHLLLVVVLVYILNKIGKNQRKKIAKLIGEKSQALLDKIKIESPQTAPSMT